MPSGAKKGTHLFIDTNVFLSFFAYSKDDLDQLKKLVNIIQTKIVRLYVTRQVINEFYRNRDAILADSFSGFRVSGGDDCPSFMTGLTEFLTYEEAAKSYKKARTALIENARLQALSNELSADKLFKRLLEEVKVIEIEDDDHKAALKRLQLGNPPGKGAKSMGDELNWELLLRHVPSNSDVHVISRDGDYASKLVPSEPKVFLTNEWAAEKNGKLFLYDKIGIFFKNNYPDEDFSLDIEKAESVKALTSTNSFATTHSAIAALLPYVPFLTASEAEELAQSALYNSQISSILADDDVEHFYKTLILQHQNDLSPAVRKQLRVQLGLDKGDAGGQVGQEASEYESSI